MSKVMKKIEYWLYPKTDRQTNIEIDTANINSIHFVCLAVCIVQSIALTIFALSNISNYNENTIMSFITVGFSVAFCIMAFFLTGNVKKNHEYLEKHHSLINVFVGLFFSIFLLWGMFVSERHFARGEQIVTFYIVELCVVMFVKLRPLVSALMIIISYASYYVYLDVFVKSGMINIYNFMLMAFISAVAAVMNYRLSVNNIRRKNRIEILNESLLLIAKHDIMTRLQNRYALNQLIPEYLEKHICVALGDIDKFKRINDKYGHDKGDDVLKFVAENLIEIFGKESVFRYGGDEFLVVSVQDDCDDFERKLQLFRERIAAGRIIEGGVHCSFGVVCGIAQNPVQFSKMISSADSELYKKKNGGIQ